MGKYEKALKQGREIVVVSDDENYNSGVFWSDGIDIFSFSVSFGTMKRSDIDFSRLENHLSDMEKEGSVFIRGWL